MCNCRQGRKWAPEQGGFSDLSMRQLLYLEAIALMEHPTFSELAEQLAVTRPSVSAIVQKLIKLGYVTKVRSTEDGRVYHVDLTSKGEQLSELHDHTHRMLAQRLTQNLSQIEIQQMAALVQKVLSG
jgi:DNA-binding MarR family transcriptional regulator